MNKGVEIMLARMESNPEEFIGNDGWTRIYNDYKKFMAEDEQIAVVAKLKELKMDEFEKQVLKKLFREENKQGELNFNTGTGQVIINAGGKTTTFTGGGVGGGGGGSVGNTLSYPTWSAPSSSTLSSTSLTIGGVEITEDDLRELKELI